MDIKRRWRVRKDRVPTINPNAYEKINLNIGVGIAESAESTLQKYDYFLNCQNFFQLFFSVDTLIENYCFYSARGKVHLRGNFCNNSLRPPLRVALAKALKELANALITLL